MSIEDVGDSVQAPKPPVWNRTLFGLVTALAVAVAGLAVQRIVLLESDASLLESIARDPNGDWGAQARSLSDLESAASVLALVLLVGLYVSAFAWVRQLAKALAPLGDVRWLYRLPAYIAWRVTVLLVVVFVFLLNAATTAPRRGSPVSDFVAYDHHLMWLIAPRIVLAAISVWFAVSLLRASNPRLAQLAPVYDDPDARPRMW